jgi:hypothetical protein
MILYVGYIQWRTDSNSIITQPVVIHDVNSKWEAIGKGIEEAKEREDYSYGAYCDLLEVQI